VKNHGSIVTKEMMLDTLWPNVFVEESNVTFNITMLRKALGDTKRSPTYIETVPRRGYRVKTGIREELGQDLRDETTTIQPAFPSGNGKLAPITITAELPPAAFDSPQGAPASGAAAAVSQPETQVRSRSFLSGQRVILLAITALVMIVSLAAII